ncbi:MAG: hypothetical protein OXF68_16910 [Gammaproteobacteria bacterium]|nr:hypothetical protein [Gammaproteobacteria bacterium]
MTTVISSFRGFALSALATACFALLAASQPAVASWYSGPAQGHVNLDDYCKEAWPKSVASSSCQLQTAKATSVPGMGIKCDIAASCRYQAGNPMGGRSIIKYRNASFSGGPTELEKLRNCDGTLTTDWPCQGW